MPALTIPSPAPALLAPPGTPHTAPMHRVVAVIAQAAHDGLACPTNEALAARLGYSKPSIISRYVRKAELAGLIRVERGHALRVVAAADGTWRTAGKITSPHWRQRAERVA